MAVLTVKELAAIRNRLEESMRGSAIPYTAPQVNAASQAVEDRLVASKSVINGDIEGAAPGVFTVPQKKIILAYTVLRWATSEAN